MRTATRLLPILALALGATLLHQASALEAGAAPAAAPAQTAGWRMYNGDYKGQRFSPLTEISAGNLNSLEQVCRLQVADGGSFQSSLVVLDRTMYLTTPLDTFAIDATSC
jgi:glucose dehydrogenase